MDIASRLERIAAQSAICLSEDAYREVRARLDRSVSDLGNTQLKNIATLRSRSPSSQANSEVTAELLVVRRPCCR
ncbi:class 3 adenylate cyclase [Rhizobium sp. BK619]|nr:class 3 adenylate cyclase [Rhizobium sp. BK619]